MIDTIFKTYPTDIAQHVIDAMTPSIEAEIKRVHEAVQAAKSIALKKALQKYHTSEPANDPPPPVDPNPPVPPKPGKRRSSWDGMSADQRSAVVKARWATRKANSTKAVHTPAPTAIRGSPSRITADPQNSKPVDLRLGDCLVEMATLADASVDLVAADLPYGATACTWDRPLDLDAFWAEVRRVLTPTGTVVLNSAGRFTADLIASNPAWYKYPLVWVKTRKSQFLHAPYRPLVAHEDVLVFSAVGACLRARKKMTYNPQGVIELSEPRVFEKAAVSAGVFKPITTKAAKRTQTHTNYPSSILTFASEGRNQHPTQKPVALMECLIATYSNPGDTVLDPTMGSGTTGVAARNLGRGFIGIEKDRQFFEIAVSRLADEARLAVSSSKPIAHHAADDLNRYRR